MIVVSPFSTGGHISHGYSDHVSILKFIEADWRLTPISPTGRDDLPNPITVDGNPYAPINSPTISDLMDMFYFNGKAKKGRVRSRPGVNADTATPLRLTGGVPALPGHTSATLGRGYEGKS
jgi:phospholipase C